MSLLDAVRRRFARAPEAVRAALPRDEQVLAWGSLTRDEGWLVATDRGLRRLAADGVAGEPLPWHEVGSATWSAAGETGGTFRVVALAEVEPGVQARQPEERHALADADERVLAWGERTDGGWTVATSRGLRVVTGDQGTTAARTCAGGRVKRARTRSRAATST